MDLVNWNKSRKDGTDDNGTEGHMPPTGFGGLSNRGKARKPVIAAVNGFALGAYVIDPLDVLLQILIFSDVVGGGTEMVLACNIVVATKRSKFGLPEVKRGVTIAAGGLARLARAVSYQVASEIALTGRFLTAEEFKSYGLVNEVIDDSADVVKAALEWAKKITAK